MVNTRRATFLQNDVPAKRTRSATTIVPVVQSEPRSQGSSGSRSATANALVRLPQNIPPSLPTITPPLPTVQKKVKIGNVEYKLKEEFWTNEMIWDEARENYKKNRAVIKQVSMEEIKKISRECFEKINADLLRLTMENKRMSKRTAKKHIENLRNAGPTAVQLDKIRSIIATGPDMALLSPQRRRYKLMSKCGQYPMYMHEDELDAPINESSNFILTEKNIPEINNAEAKLRARELSTLEIDSEFCCSCTGQCDPNTCECQATEKVFRMPFQNDYLFRRRYRCNDGCACEGKCGIQDPEGGIEVVFHHQKEKGFATRATVFHSKGSTVAEMTGHIQDNLEKFEDYAMDFFNGARKSRDDPMPEDCRFFNQLMESTEETRIPGRGTKNFKKALEKYRQFKAGWSREYNEKIEVLFKKDWSVNPTTIGNHGRFLASSCFANTRSTIVYSKGLSPLNARIFFTALMPIFPNMEINFFYSTEYVENGLATTCCCGTLACITAQKIWPFVTEAHIVEFYSDLYEKAWNQYKEEVVDKV